MLFFYFPPPPEDVSVVSKKTSCLCFFWGGSRHQMVGTHGGHQEWDPEQTEHLVKLLNRPGPDGQDAR